LECHADIVAQFLEIYSRSRDKSDIDLTADIQKSTNTTYCTGERHTYRKIYVSRSRLSASKRKLAEEEILEKLLCERGWTILYPELADLRLQIDLYSKASILAGTEGSAFHLLYGVRNTGLRVALLSVHPISNFTQQFSAQKIPYIVLECLIPSGIGTTFSHNYTADSGRYFGELRSF